VKGYEFCAFYVLDKTWSPTYQVYCNACMDIGCISPSIGPALYFYALGLGLRRFIRRRQNEKISATREDSQQAGQDMNRRAEEDGVGIGLAPSRGQGAPPPTAQASAWPTVTVLTLISGDSDAF
jgi:hypothetical protein